MKQKINASLLGYLFLMDYKLFIYNEIYRMAFTTKSAEFTALFVVNARITLFILLSRTGLRWDKDLSWDIRRLVIPTWGGFGRNRLA